MFGKLKKVLLFLRLSILLLLSRLYHFINIVYCSIDIGPELASRIIHKSQVFSTGKKVPREQKEPTLFDEAQSILFKELLPYWAGFSKQYTQPEDESKVKLPRKYFVSLFVLIRKCRIAILE